MLGRAKRGHRPGRLRRRAARCNPARSRPEADRTLTRFASKLADRVIVPSRRSAERLRAAGVDIGGDHPGGRARGGSPDEIARPRPLSSAPRSGSRSGRAPGRARWDDLARAEGRTILVEALASLEPAQRRWKLVIGGEPYRRRDDFDFERRISAFVAEHELTDSVFFAGAISDVEAFHAAADVFVNPARVEESFGRAACEALLNGCPVVATRPAAAEGILEDGRTALIVPVDNPPATAEAVDRFLDDRDLARSTSDAGAAEVRRRCDFWVRQPSFEATLSEALIAADVRSAAR